MNDYFSVAREAHDEVTISRSRFIGYACPCESEEEAIGFLQRIRGHHRDARHHCYAYIIGPNQGIMRYSDDGEPCGTAGLPILNVLRGEGVVNCCVVVVRYFGGILLGTGGLVRAYTQGTQIALAAAEIRHMEWSVRTLCEVPYPVWDAVQYTLRHLPARISKMEYGTAITFCLETRQRDTELVFSELEKASARQLETLPDGEGFVAWPADEKMS